MTCRFIRLPLLGAALFALSAPALAQPGAPLPNTPLPNQPLGYEQPGMVQPVRTDAAWQRAREDWLAECRRNHKGRKGKVTGAVVGGLLGGVIGNQVAGEGDRTLGTVAGVAVGAVTGGAIGSHADSNRARDFCEDYLDRYTAQGAGYYPAGYAPAGYTYAYQPMMVMMPVIVAAAPAPARKRDCVETTVIEEWVEVGPRRHHKRPVARPIPDKRVKIVPDKRVRAD